MKTKIFIFISIVLLYSCQDLNTVDYNYYATQIIKNETTVSINLKVYFNNQLMEYMEIDPQKKDENGYYLGKGNIFSPFNIAFLESPDSVIIIFDNTKKILFKHQDTTTNNPCHIESFTEEKDVSEHTNRYTYTITQDMYDNAEVYSCSCQ